MAAIKISLRQLIIFKLLLMLTQTLKLQLLAQLIQACSQISFLPFSLGKVNLIEGIRMLGSDSSSTIKTILAVRPVDTCTLSRVRKLWEQRDLEMMQLVNWEIWIIAYLWLGVTSMITSLERALFKVLATRTTMALGAIVMGDMVK